MVVNFLSGIVQCPFRRLIRKDNYILFRARTSSMKEFLQLFVKKSQKMNVLKTNVLDALEVTPKDTQIRRGNFVSSKGIE